MTMRKKRKFKSIISTFLCLALLGGAVFGVTKLLKNDSDTVEIKASAFAVGALDEEGKYVENKQTLYTKEMFLCDGLTVELDKDCKSTYQIFYYDEDGEFIEASEVLTEDFEEDIADGAVNARIMITPEIPEDKTAEDFKINFFTKYSYLKGITITVNKPVDNTEDMDSGIVNLIQEVQKSMSIKFYMGDVSLENTSGMSVAEISPTDNFWVVNNGEEDITVTVYTSEDYATSLCVYPGSKYLISSVMIGDTMYIDWYSSDPIPLVYYDAT